MNQLLKIHSKQKVLLISTFYFLIISFSTAAHDSIAKKSYHVIGAGVQFLADRYSGYGHDFHSIKYSQPGVVLSYKQIRFFKPRNKVIIFNSNLFYRKGSGSSSSGGQGGGSYSSGGFELLRLDIGVSKAIAPLELKGLLISAGFNIGALIFTKGEVNNSEFSGATNYYKSSINSIYTALDPINISINFEISQRFKLAKNSFILIGSKTQVETPEGFGARLGLIENVFLAYMFR